MYNKVSHSKWHNNKFLQIWNLNIIDTSHNQFSFSLIFCHRFITFLLIYFSCYWSSANKIQINKEKLSLKYLTKHIHDLSCVVLAWTMHKYGSHEHFLYFTQLEWNESNTTFLSSGMFFERNYLFGYIVFNSLKNALRMCFHVLKTIFSMGLHPMVFKKVFLASDKFSMEINFIPEPINI